MGTGAFESSAKSDANWEPGSVSSEPDHQSDDDLPVEVEEMVRKNE
jgi:hypothetical protein